jgi:hypothetical protein
MYARVIPDQMGRPHTLKFSALAAKTIGDMPLECEVTEQGTIVVRKAVSDGLRITKTKTLPIKALLIGLNNQKRLSGDPVPVRRLKPGSSEFTIFVYEPNPNLAGGTIRDAMPMLVRSRTESTRQVKPDTIIKAHALTRLLYVTEGEQKTRVGLEYLASDEVIALRFGSKERFEAFVEYQMGSWAHLNADEVKMRLVSLLPQEK